jgi:hypothetical protein
VNASINLRGDLAKLSDAELAERLKAAWRDVDAARGRKQPFWLFRPIYPWRGPFRHPRAYRFLSILSATEGHWIGALIAAVFSGKQSERFIRTDPWADQYLSISEVQDIMDEIERRLSARGSQKWTPRPGGTRHRA